MENKEMEFVPFPKIARLSREIVVSEKIDGTSGTIYIGENDEFLVGSKNKWITPNSDNYGFASWAYNNKNELLKLGIGWHRGEWWGNGIQRGYNLKEKRFSLFNTFRWTEETLPSCCSVVPVLYKGDFSSDMINITLESLKEDGSKASPGFMNPEGIIIFHTSANMGFKKTIKDDNMPKSLIEDKAEDMN